MIRCLPLLLLLFAGGAAGGENWLTRASEAVRTTDYRGTLVYLRNGKMDSLRIVHRFNNGNERARLVSLTGEPREIIRAKGVVTCVLPAQQLVLVARQPNRDDMFSDVSRLADGDLSENYEIRDLGVRRLADRKCRVVAIDAKDEFRYGYQLLIDIETNLPLKLDLLRGGEVLEQLMFTEITFPERIPDSALESSFKTKGFRRVQHHAVEVHTTPQADSGWHATALPPGFRLVESGLRKVGGKAMARQLLFTDGIATVSAFIAPIQGREAFTGATTLGAVNAYGRKINGHQITVVGEVPRVTVRFIAEHIRGGASAAAQSPSNAR